MNPVRQLNAGDAKDVFGALRAIRAIAGDMMGSINIKPGYAEFSEAEEVQEEYNYALVNNADEILDHIKELRGIIRAHIISEKELGKWIEP